MIIWVVTLRGLVDGYQYFGGTYRLHLQGLFGINQTAPQPVRPLQNSSSL
jgi:hypothetical protein